MKIQIVKLLLKEDLITLDQLREALEKAQNTGVELSDALFELDFISENELLDFLGKSSGVPVISIDEHSVDEDVLNLIPREIAIENRLIPLNITGSALTIAMSDPSNIILRDELSFLTEKNIIPVVVSERSIVNMLEKYHGYSGKNSEDSEKEILALEEMLSELNKDNKDNPQENDQSIFISQEMKEAESTEVDSLKAEDNFEPEIPEAEQNISLTKDAQKTDSQSSLDNDPAMFEQEAVEEEETLPKEEDYNTEPMDDHFMSQPSDKELSSPELSEPQYDTSSSNTDDIPDIENDLKEKDFEPREINVHSKSVSEDVVTPDYTGQTVLVIDHSPTVQKLMALSLRRKGYSVSTVSDGMEALSHLHDLKPDLIFIEINLSHMDGYRVCKIIKSHGLMKKVPVVMMSGKEGLFDKMRSKMAGADGHLSKPFALNDIAESAASFTEASNRSIASA